MEFSAPLLNWVKANHALRPEGVYLADDVKQWSYKYVARRWRSVMHSETYKFMIKVKHLPLQPCECQM